MANDPTLLNAVATICKELALPVPTSVVGFNQQVVQLVACVNRACEDISNGYDWPVQRKLCTMIPGAVTTFQLVVPNYTVDKILPLTAWDVTNKWRFVGSINDEDWAWWQNGIMTAPIRKIWRTISDDTVEVFPVPSVTDTFAINVMVEEWGIDSATLLPTSVLGLDADYHLFHPRMVIALAKSMFLDEKGLPSAGAFSEYTQLSDIRQAIARPPRRLSLSKGRGRIHLVDYANVPETGFGS